jgi:GalNAc-alpha-(1->4)-GalNAc-alpha-(1->3)-diNAcBac-PP-undecaprenol alpha-1,4-N-acetyl-D-galactosaminyltransferase
MMYTIDKSRLVKKRLCFIGQGLGPGGQERHLSGLANYYARAGFDVSIINLFKTEQFFQIDESIEIIWPVVDRSKHHRLIYAALIIPFLRKNLNRIKPDVILSFGEWSSPFVVLSTRFINRPLFLFEMMGPNINLGWLIEFARRHTYKYAKGVIVQTRIASDIIREKTRASNVAVIPTPLNVINTDISVKKKQIISVGRLSPEKGHKILIQAFSSLAQKDWMLHIIGDGVERQRLEKEVSTIGLSERIIFHGYKKDFAQLLGESEIFVLPSFYEGFPNALIEAMSVPLACISSDCVAGPSEIIENGENGLLVEPGNINDLASALDRLIEDPALRKKIALNALKVRETLCFEKIAQQYLDFILE